MKGIHVLRHPEERFCERFDRCDAAATSCEELTKEMETRLRQASRLSHSTFCMVFVYDMRAIKNTHPAEVSSELRAHQQLVSVLAPSLQSIEADSAPLLRKEYVRCLFRA